MSSFVGGEGLYCALLLESCMATSNPRSRDTFLRSSISVGSLMRAVRNEFRGAVCCHEVSILILRIIIFRSIDLSFMCYNSVKHFRDSRYVYFEISEGLPTALRGNVTNIQYLFDRKSSVTNGKRRNIGSSIWTNKLIWWLF